MSKINSAESIRGLACLAVVFSHLSLIFYPYLHNAESAGLPSFKLLYYWHHSPFAFFYAGTAAVYVFFVLSGFVLSYAILNKANHINQKIISMSIKRYPRLAIPAACSVLLYWIAFQFHLNMGQASDWIAQLGSQTGSLVNALYDGLIGSFIFGEATYNWVLWTMQIELFGSFVIFILSYLQLTQKRAALLFAIAVILCSGLVISIYFALSMLCFMIGMMFYFYGKKISLNTSITLLLVGLYLAGVHNTSWSYQWIYQILGESAYDIINIISAPCIVYSILMNYTISQALDKKPLVFLGKLSFSIYLLHLLVIYMIAMPLYHVLLHPFGFLISSMVACFITILITILMSIPYSHYVDDFAIQVGKIIEYKLLKNR